MRRRLLAALSAAAAVSVSFVSLATSAAAAPSEQGSAMRNTPVCAKPAAGYAGCHAIRRDTLDRNGNPVNAASAGTPAGYGPSDIQAAYGLTGASGSGRTVAIVDAYDDPTAAADLATYRSKFGLPACVTGTGAGCLTKVNENGAASPLPAANGGWAQEISLDLDMVSAACPGCSILLVEASSASFADLSKAVDTAASKGVVAISNSYGGSDINGTTSGYGSAYDHPGIAVTASTGDNGYGVESPASFAGVVAVGGTSLKKSGTTYSETAWSGAGSGCSTLNQPLFTQTGTSCSGKATADVSAVADPNTGVAVYDSTRYQGRSGWMVFGGTSASSPIIASVFALANDLNGAQAGSKPWGNPGALHDVTSGSNGTCTTKVWCTSGAGWDGPTGLGTPNGTGAF